MAHIEATMQLVLRERQLSILRSAVETAKAIAPPHRLPLVILYEIGEPGNLVLTSMSELEKWLDKRGIYTI